MARIGRKPADYELIEGGAGGGRSGGGSISGGGGLSKKEGAAMLGAPAALGGAAVGGSVYAGKKQDAAERDKTVVRTENMRRAAAKPVDESVRHYKGMANATKQK